MTQANYAAMSDQELRAYFLAHREDESAFHAYMDRRYARPRTPLVAAGELDQLPFDEQQRIIDERMAAHFNLSVPEKDSESV